MTWSWGRWRSRGSGFSAALRLPKSIRQREKGNFWEGLRRTIQEWVEQSGRFTGNKPKPQPSSDWLHVQHLRLTPIYCCLFMKLISKIRRSFIASSVNTYDVNYNFTPKMLLSYRNDNERGYSRTARVWNRHTHTHREREGYIIHIL